MNNRLFQRITIIATVTFMTGCSSLFGDEGYFRDRGSDYQKADVIEPMLVPQGVAIQHIDDLYRIPPAEENSFHISGEFETPRPQPLGENAFTDRVKIQKLSGDRWILISEKPSEVWPHVRRFLSVNRLGVAFTDATTGVIETDWLRFKDDEESKNKYRLNIEQGVQPNSTEIHVTHLGANKDDTSTSAVVWPEESTSAERESWMIDELSAALASVAESGQAASLLAQTIGLADKVDLVMDGNEPTLQLKLSYSRAWATLSHAVQKNGFYTWEQDDLFGVFYVDFHSSDEESGWFSRKFGSGDDLPETPYGLSEVLQHIQLDDDSRKIFSSMTNSASEPLEDVPGYLVVIRGESGNIEVRVRDGYANTLPVKQAKQLLNVIRRNLI